MILSLSRALSLVNGGTKMKKLTTNSWKTIISMMMVRRNSKGTMAMVRETLPTTINSRDH